MAVVTPKEIYACAQPTGYFQFGAAGQHHLALLERGEDESGSTFTILRYSAGQWAAAKKTRSKDVSIHAVDGWPAGGDLIFGLEVNGDEALQIVSANLFGLLDPGNRTVPFGPLADIVPAEIQIEKVQLPVTRRWNVATPLAPRKWLFSPRVVRGATGSPQLIANTADGQAMIFGAEPKPDLEGFSIPNAAEPQAFILDGRRYVAFKRYGEPYYPFWKLPRYSGEATPTGGDLMVAVDRDEARNLSREHAIGPVLAFALSAAPDGRLWIFALIDAPVGTDVVALMQRESEWSIEGRWSVDLELLLVSAEYGMERWQLVYALRTSRGWSLRHHSWGKN